MAALETAVANLLLLGRVLSIYRESYLLVIGQPTIRWTICAPDKRMPPTVGIRTIRASRCCSETAQGPPIVGRVPWAVWIIHQIDRYPEYSRAPFPGLAHKVGSSPESQGVRHG